MDEPQAIKNPLPAPPPAAAEGGGLSGALRNSLNAVTSVVKIGAQRISENQTVQKVAGGVKNVGGKVVEKTKAGAAKVGEKTQEGWSKINENERIHGAIEGTKSIARKSYDNTKAAGGKVVEKSKVVGGKIAEKSQPLVDKTKELGGRIGEKAQPLVAKGKSLVTYSKAKGGKVWEAGGGMIKKVKNELEEGGWRGNAKETLLRKKDAEEKWNAIRIRGAEELQVAARKEYTTNYFVEKGTLLRWSFRVQDKDIGFGVRVRIMQDGGSREEDVLPVEKFDNTDTIEGHWTADEDRTIVLVFDNTYSLMRSKTIAYLVGVETGAQAAASVEAEEGEAAAIAAASNEEGEAAEEADPATADAN